MTLPVTLPFWLIILLVIFATIGIVDRVFAPSVRWFFRRKVNSAIDELNTRLDMRIQPFRLTRRQTLIDQLMYDPKIVEAVDAEAQNTKTPRAVIMKRAERYAREIVPSFSPLAYFGIGTRLARWLSEFVYRVKLGYSDDEKLAEISSDASVVFVMNHRSNMDYVLVTYMASAKASLSYAVGEWARIWGLQGLIRAMGAYFIRRASNDELYRRVLSRYVSMATQQGVTQAVFPEGGLSRDGKLRKPKLGLLSYMISDFDFSKTGDIVFIPVGINYDRVLEDRILTRELEREESGREYKTSLSGIIHFLAHLIWLRFKGKLYRFGYACVSFGTPLSLKQWQQDHKVDLDALDDKPRFQKIEQLGDELLHEVGKVIPVLPVAVVAQIFLELGDEPIGELELKSMVFDRFTQLENQGAHPAASAHRPRLCRINGVADADASPSGG